MLLLNSNFIQKCIQVYPSFTGLKLFVISDLVNRCSQRRPGGKYFRKGKVFVKENLSTFNFEIFCMKLI